MNLQRLKILEELVIEEPNDPFNIYALALEYLSSNKAKSELLFDHLLKDHPDYVPTYYQAGNYFFEKGDTAKALSILNVGLMKSKTAGDLKARGEIQGLIDMFED